jgi:alkylation response protein AidB-like acyl-CoA dehydrogenase
MHLTDTQQMLRDSLERYLASRYDVDTRARTLATAHGTPPLWRVLSHDLGLLGAAFSEAQGGLGGGVDEHLVVLETLGRHLAAEPYLGAMVQAGGLLRRVPGEGAARLLRQMIDGERLVVLAITEPLSRHDWREVCCALTPAPGGGWRLDGHKAMVHGAPWADELIVLARNAGTAPSPQGLSWVRVPRGAAGLARRDIETLDGGRASELRFEAVAIPADQLLGPPGEAGAWADEVLDETTLGLGAEALGVLDRLLADTLAYARQRHQFGVPIASFQVLQHRLADMHLALEQARAMVHQAPPALLGPASERQRVISSTQVAVARACRTVGQGAIQIHGGMGMTHELAIGHFFRRATLIGQHMGSLDHHLRRVEATMG